MYWEISNNQFTMGRPKKWRRIRFTPEAYYFKPQGIPMRMLAEENLGQDEMEAVRLCDLEGLNMLSAAAKMKLSKSTVHRLLNAAHQKIARALIKGLAIRIERDI